MTTLANQIDSIQNSFNIPQILNWGVKYETVQTESGIILPNRKAIVRDDNQTVIGLHSDSYTAMDNFQLWEIISKVADLSGHSVAKAGLFNGGGKVWIQLKSDDLSLDGDKVEGFSTAVNSFDGTTLIGFGHTNVTISCRNSFFSAYKELKKVKHTKNMDNNVEELLRGFEASLKDEKVTFEQIKRMYETQLDKKLVDVVARKLFGVELVGTYEDLEVSTKKLNQINKFNEVLQHEIQEKGDNLWGLFSGVTYYTTHEYGHTKGDSMEQKMFRGIGDNERHIFDFLGQKVNFGVN